MPKTVCISGCNITDGMGDLAHILNVGENIRRQYSDSVDVVYEFEWKLTDDENNEFNKNRVKELIDKLQDLKIIQPLTYNESMSTRDILDELNKKNSKRLNIFTLKQNLRIWPMEEEFNRKEVFKEADLYIVTSSPALSMSQPKYHRLHKQGIGLGTPDKTIFCLEHATSKKQQKGSMYDFRYNFADPDMNKEDKLYSDDDFLQMGFGFSDNKKMAGLLLEKSALPTQESKISALRKLKNSSFHKLLHGKAENPDRTQATHLEQNTIFVPNYHSHGRDQALTMFLNFYKSTLITDHRDIFMQGNFNLEEFEQNKASLIEAGFTSVEFLNKHTDEIQVIPLITENEAIPEKKLKIFTKKLDNKDYKHFTHCADLVSGCSGDNTLQDAINTGAIPLFMPNERKKAEVLDDLRSVIMGLDQSENKYESCIKFLEMYENFDDINGYNFIASKTDPYSFELLSQWPRLCTLLKENYNAHDMLCDTLEQKLGVEKNKFLSSEEENVEIEQAEIEQPEDTIRTSTDHYEPDKDYNDLCQQLIRLIEEKDWHIGLLGGVSVDVGNGKDHKTLPTHVAELYDELKKPPNTPQAYEGKINQLSKIIEHRDMPESIIDKVKGFFRKVDFFNLCSRSQDTENFYMETMDKFKNLKTKYNELITSKANPLELEDTADEVVQQNPKI